MKTCLKVECHHCKYHDITECVNHLMKESLSLILHYQNEIDKLNHKISDMEKEIDDQYDMAEASIRANIADGGTSCHWCEDTMKKQAIKEFANGLEYEILHGEFCNQPNTSQVWLNGYEQCLRDIRALIKNKVTEMTYREETLKEVE